MLGRWVTRIVDAQARWATPFGDFNHRWLTALFGPIRPVKDFLNGTWLGHPVHAALTDLPIGVMTVAIILDIIGQRVAADVAVLVGVLSIVATAVSGLADYTDVDGKARSRATVHATVMTIALIVFAISLLIRAGNPADRAVPIVLLVIGYLILTVGAEIGGDLVYLVGTNVNRHAWRGAGLPGDVEDDREQQGPDRKIRCGRVERVAEPGPVEEVLHRPDRSEEGAQPAVVEVAEWSSPAILGSHETGEQTTHAVPPARVYPQTVHIAWKFGDNFRRVHGKFVDKPVVAPWVPPVHFVLPEGAG